jgi:hypothetical protein
MSPAVRLASCSAPWRCFPASAAAPTRTLERFYHWVFLVLFLSAVALAVLNWDEVWWLAFVGAASYGLALLGYLAAKRRWDGWLRAHVAGQGGSYIAMVTALLVVNTGGGSPLPWIVPTLIGTPIITWVSNQIAAGKRPKGRLTTSGQRGASRA